MHDLLICLHDFFCLLTNFVTEESGLLLYRISEIRSKTPFCQFESTYFIPFQKLSTIKSLKTVITNDKNIEKKQAVLKKLVEKTAR
jgi:hypothetical protein